MTPLERFLEKLGGARACGTGWSARCPAHEDRNPSLSVSEGDDGRVLVKCHRGCEAAAVCAALGLSLRDLMPDTNEPRATFGGRAPGGRAPKVYPTAEAALGALKAKLGASCRTWTYHDPVGRPVGVVARWDTERGKDIRPVSRCADGWTVAAMLGPRPLYDLPGLSRPGPVLVVEGEPCADAARALGFVSTTSVGGAQAAKRSDWSPLTGREVYVLPDHDAAGRKYANDVAHALARMNPLPVVKVLDPAAVFGRPDLPAGYDLADALAARPDEAGRAALGEAVRRAAQTVRETTARKPFSPDLICFADVIPAEVKWLWLGRLPLGRISMLAGRPGAGKSFFTCDASARVSTGADWPDGAPAPLGDVLLICAEDDPHDTIAPRLIGAGANCHRVHLLRAARVERADGEEASVAFDLSNVELIRDALAQLPACKLVVIDPIGSYLGGGVDGYRDNEVRAVLAPLALLASETDVAVLLVAHNRKSSADFADDTVLGSRAFTGLARSVLHLIPDPDDRGRKLLLPGKCNLGAPAPGLAYRIAGAPPRLEWEPDPVELHADDRMPKWGAPDGARGRAPAARLQASRGGRVAGRVAGGWPGTGGRHPPTGRSRGAVVGHGAQGTAGTEHQTAKRGVLRWLGMGVTGRRCSTGSGPPKAPR